MNNIIYLKLFFFIAQVHYYQMDSIFYLANLCKFSYKGVTLPGHDFSNAKIIEVGSSKMIVLRKQKSIIICVTGTDSLDDMLLDTDIRMASLEYDGQTYGRVHRGFYTYLLRLWPTIIDEIDQLLDDNNSSDLASSPLYTYNVTPQCRESLDQENSAIMPLDQRTSFKLQKFRVSLLESLEANKPTVVFTGHSLGSCCAIAALLASLKYNGQLKIRCITFASPKLGDKQWVRSYHKHVTRNFRVVHNHDIVAMLPLGRAYKHLNDEVRIGNNGGYLLRHKGILHLMLSSLRSWCHCFKKKKGEIQEQFIADHMIDYYIKAMQTMFEIGIQSNSEENVMRTVGSIDMKL